MMHSFRVGNIVEIFIHVNYIKGALVVYDIESTSIDQVKSVFKPERNSSNNLRVLVLFYSRCKFDRKI